MSSVTRHTVKRKDRHAHRTKGMKDDVRTAGAEGQPPRNPGRSSSSLRRPDQAHAGDDVTEAPESGTR